MKRIYLIRMLLAALMFLPMAVFARGDMPEPTETIQALYLKQKYPEFYEIVTQNSAKSNADRNICIKGLLCLSGLANLDLKYYNTRGRGAPGDYLGIGLRPLTGFHQTNFLGSVNNINLFFDAAVNDWVSGHLDLAYVNANHQARYYALEEVDWGSEFRSGAAIKMSEAYFLLANPERMPFYVQIGRFTLDYGQFDRYPMVQSLTQLLSMVRTGGVIAGAIFDNGLYFSANWTTAQQSIENLYFIGNVASGGSASYRNFGGRVGYKTTFGEVAFNGNVSYINDMRDAEYILEGADFLNSAGKLAGGIYDFFTSGYNWKLQRAGGVAFHADLQYGRFGLSGDFVTATRKLNPNSEFSQIRAWGVNASVDFEVNNYPIRFEAGYQGSENSEIFTADSTLNPFPPGFGGEDVTPYPLAALLPGAILPANRFTAALYVVPLPNTTISFQWVTDWDYRHFAGTAETGNMGVARVSFEL